MVRDLTDEIAVIHDAGGLAVVCADLLALALLVPPGEMGRHCCWQRAAFWRVVWFWRSHAAYFACSQALQRSIPGRIVGVSRDQWQASLSSGIANPRAAYSPGKATSNICTAQALLQSWPVSMLSGMVQADSKTLRHTAIGKLDDLLL